MYNRGMPRFVFLKHTMPDDSPRVTHWDLMLERQGVLRTWSLNEPLQDGRQTRATKLSDHRLEYLDYEGEVSGGRGAVSRIDVGAYRVVREDDSTVQLALRGTCLIGTATLSHDKGQCWRVVFVADSAAS
jgi:hypothetical protein